MTGGARQGARLSFRLAGLGFFAAWAPPGGQRERWRRPQRTEAARVLRLKARTAAARGGRGPHSEMGARRSQAQAAWFVRLEREAGDPPYAERFAAEPP